MPAIDEVFAAIAAVLPAVPPIFRAIASIFEPVPPVFEAISTGPLRHGRIGGDWQQQSGHQHPWQCPSHDRHKVSVAGIRNDWTAAGPSGLRASAGRCIGWDTTAAVSRGYTVSVSSVDPGLVARLHTRARASRWGLSVADLQASLDASVSHASQTRPVSPADVEHYIDGLHLDDLALAAACAAGHDAAWDHFVQEYRPILYRAADAIDPSGAARELADALYADLFGLKEHAGRRQSLFRYFHGRSSLSTWLRAVLAQRHVDRIRSGRRHDPLPDDEGGPPIPMSPTIGRAEPSRFVALLRVAVVAAISALAPRDRLRFSLYYAQDLTLAAIGRLLGEHEATVSRHLTRTRREIRDVAERRLRDDHGLDAASIAEGLRSATQDAETLDLSELVTASEAGAGKNDGRGRSK